jgi:DNA-binding transcriptional regulator LsrR (DeoR family)
MKKRKSKMTNEERHRKLLEAAWLFCYGQGSKPMPMKKNQIAKRLGTTPTQITRWIEEAEGLNIIQYRCVPPGVDKLELQLAQKYPFLLDVIVIPSVGDFAAARIARGRRVARYFEDHVEDGMTVAFAGGNTLYEMAIELHQRPRNIEIAPAAIVGRGPTIDHIDPGIIVSIVWAKAGGKPMGGGARRGDMQCGARAYSTSIQPYEPLGDARAANAARAVQRLTAKLRDQPSISAVLKKSSHADILFTSCGPLEVDAEHRKHFTNTTLQLLEKLGIRKSWLISQGIVGDICYTPIDNKGEGRAEWQFFPAIGPDDLRRMAASRGKRVVLTAGAYSTQGVRAALAGRLCNVLIIDETEAVKLSETN